MTPDDARRTLASPDASAPPLPDLAPSILAAIAERQRAPAPDRMLPAAAGVSVMLALVATLLAAGAWRSLDNPLTPLSSAPAAQLAEGP